QPARSLRRDLEAEEGLAGTARAARRPHRPAGPAGTGTAGRSRVPKIAVVTGGSSGIGAAVARKLTERGWSCVLVARGEERLRAVAGELGAEWERCDVGDRSEVERIAAAIRERHPEIGLLVNGAGIPGRGGFLRADAELIETVTRTNYLGGVWCLRAFLPALEAAAPSHVVNVVSVAGTISSGAAGPYSASKHAQLAFSRAARSELRERGIHVHTVLPGFVETPGFPQRSRFSGSLLRAVVVEPELVANRIVAAVERDRAEIFVPRYYRIATLAQVFAPGLVARAGKRGIRPAGE
ncbi:MAG: SDR family oxidoreductase, partial [Actinobacteria bacterium]